MQEAINSIDKFCGINDKSKIQLLASKVFSLKIFLLPLYNLLFKIGYKGHNPTVKTIRDVKWEANVLNQFDTIKPTAQITNAINSVLPAFKELERHNLYNRDFFEKLAIVESNSGDPKQMISDTDDYGVFQINIDAIGKTFNDESSFNNSFF